MRSYYILTLALLSANASAANLVYSNLGPSDGYDPNVGYTVSGTSSPVSIYQYVAMSFVSTRSEPLASIDVALVTITGGDFRVEFRGADSGGGVGSLLESWYVPSAPSSASGSLVHLPSTTAASLAFGTKYWVVAMVPTPSSSSFGAWQLNTTSNTGEYALGVPAGLVYKNGPRSAFRVESVPEPATLVAFSAAVAGAFLRRRKA
ncbi:PEP-CTERM sorting domain-containing protein [bacterium]|nr:MAG: PEP-CTERM sorting domain-containing protein [bacterium]